MRQELTENLATGTGRRIDEIILAHLPGGFDFNKISRQRWASASYEIWLYDGIPFLELHDPVFKTVYDDGTGASRIEASISYRRV